jgi:AraC-like DNA-binding protein
MINLNPEISVAAIICLSFFSIGLYAFLIRRNRSNASTLFLLLFCISLGLNQLYDLLAFNRVYGRYFRFLDEFSLLISFSSLYFYVVSLTQNLLRLQKKYLVHLLPMLLFLLLWVFPLPFIEQYHNSYFLQTFYKYYNNIQGIIYVFLINTRVNQHQQILKDLSSTARGNDLNWVRIMVGILLIIVFFWTLSGFEKDPFNLTGYALLIFSYWLGYHIIVQKSIDTGMPAEFERTELRERKNRYKNSTLSVLEKSQMAEHMKHFMSTEKPYLNNELTLTSLADRLKMKPIHLSQILNEEFNENFYTFINRYRVNESQKLLLDPR